MTTCTVTFTFGTPDRWAKGSVACASLADAAREATKCIAHEHHSPLLAVEILSGDHAPRLSNGAWVAAPAGGWEG